MLVAAWYVASKGAAGTRIRFDGEGPSEITSRGAEGNKSVWLGSTVGLVVHPLSGVLFVYLSRSGSCCSYDVLHVPRLGAPPRHCMLGGLGGGQATAINGRAAARGVCSRTGQGRWVRQDRVGGAHGQRQRVQETGGKQRVNSVCPAKESVLENRIHTLLQGAAHAGHSQQAACSSGIRSMATSRAQQAVCGTERDRYRGADPPIHG
jgi:hypothetical protein